MNGFRKKVVVWVMTLALVIGAMSVGVFASDYEGHWAKNAITKWAEKGIVKGYSDGTFKPARQVTRAELAVFITRLFGLTDLSQAKTYEDVPQGKWYADDIAKVSSAGLMYVEGSKFMPDKPATREEAAYAIAKAYKISGKTSKAFSDEDQIASWAKESVNTLFAKGYVSGKGADQFGPEDILTRADVIAMIDKITSQLINKAGTYTENVNGNLVVNTRDVVLKDMTIKGNLYLAEGIGNGDVTLEGITVEGKTFIEGGGINSIKSRDSKFYDSLQVSANNPVRLVVQGDSVRVEALTGATVTLTGNFKEVIVTENVNMIMRDAQVQNVIVQPSANENQGAKPPVIEIAAGSVVKQIQADGAVETTGSGTVGTLIVNAPGVKIAQKPETTTIKSSEIKVEIAGKEQTQSTVNTPASSGGGGGGSSSPEPTVPARCLVKGKVTCEGEAVEYAIVNLWQRVGDDSKHIAYIETKADGTYSFYASSGKNYCIEAFVIDEYGYGYQQSKENITVNANPTTINIELVKRYIADITLEDKNGTPVREAKIVEIGDENNTNWWHTDNYGFAGIFLWEDRDYNFEIFINDVKVGEKKGIRREDGFKTDCMVTLDLGLSDTINGTAIFESDDQPAANMQVILEKMNKDQTTTKHSHWDYVDSTVTDEDGKFSFGDIDSKENYQLNVRNEEGNVIHISMPVNALVVDRTALKVKQGYVIDVTVLDEIGIPVDNAVVKILNEDGGWFETTVGNDGKARMCFPEMEPGKAVIQVTYSDQVSAQDLVIEAGKYYYEKAITLKNVTSSSRLVAVTLTGTMDLAGSTAIPYEIGVEGNGEGRWTHIKDGKADIIIPEDFIEKEAGKETVTVTVLNEEGTILCKKSGITLTASRTEVTIDLREVPAYAIGNIVTSVTTGSVIDIVTPSMIYIGKDSINGLYNEVLSGQDIDPNTKLPKGKYKVVAEYTDGGQNYRGWKDVILLDTNQSEVEIGLKPVVDYTVRFVDEENNPIGEDIYIDIQANGGSERWPVGSGEQLECAFEKNKPVTIILCNGSDERYTIVGATQFAIGGIAGDIELVLKQKP
ncbi:MAG: family 16 glycosylhydrolase [Clostridia bacterium]|jgi:protocatechuate 3,4-dioxygenase beta subunit|nr:family 16 glycosylhydrolase [Clostridia bacterium]